MFRTWWSAVNMRERVSPGTSSCVMPASSRNIKRNLLHSEKSTEPIRFVFVGVQHTQINARWNDLIGNLIWYWFQLQINIDHWVMITLSGAPSILHAAAAFCSISTEKQGPKRQGIANPQSVCVHSSIRQNYRKNERPLNEPMKSEVQSSHNECHLPFEMYCPRIVNHNRFERTSLLFCCYLLIYFGGKFVQ